MMKGDYVTIQHVDNGYLVEANKFADDRNRRSSNVARTEEELHAILQRLFPVVSESVDAASH